MKQKDIIILAGIIFVSAVISMVVSKAIFAGKQSSLSATVVQPITANFPEPDKHYFNKDSFDPTKLITISSNNNTDPFSGSHQ